jgi:hypothetical protein
VNRGDTSRTCVVPRLQATHWENNPHSLKHTSLTDGRIVVVRQQSAAAAAEARGLPAALHARHPIAVVAAVAA